jgi:hypothetical protein
VRRPFEPYDRTRCRQRKPYRESSPGRSQHYFLEFQSLFEQLRGASREELARIMATVGGPTLLARLGATFAAWCADDEYSPFVAPYRVPTPR